MDFFVVVLGIEIVLFFVSIKKKQWNNNFKKCFQKDFNYIVYPQHSDLLKEWIWIILMFKSKEFCSTFEFDLSERQAAAEVLPIWRARVECDSATGDCTRVGPGFPGSLRPANHSPSQRYLPSHPPSGAIHLRQRFTEKMNEYFYKMKTNR